MSDLESWAWLIFVILIWHYGGYMLRALDGDNDNKNNNNNNNYMEPVVRDKETIYKNTPEKIKCRCLQCKQVVMIPKRYLDLTTRNPQTSHCPNCDWKMRKVKIIQESGLWY